MTVAGVGAESIPIEVSRTGGETLEVHLLAPIGCCTRGDTLLGHSIVEAFYYAADRSVRFDLGFPSINKLFG